MEPLLSTITPYWGRPEMLRCWWTALRDATLPYINHIVFFVNEDPPSWWWEATARYNVQTVRWSGEPNLSIGHFHNEGAALAKTKWMMKLDVDAFPNTRFFTSLLPVLRSAPPRKWFNAGVFYLNRDASTRYLTERVLPLHPDRLLEVISNLERLSASSYRLPAASNFICRREDYLALGGCDSCFRGYGWEDYQQLYSLERYWRQEDPLPGPLVSANVTQRCRDEIGRPAANELWEKNPMLVLLHKWHGSSSDPAYKARETIDKNRELLLRSIYGMRGIE